MMYTTKLLDGLDGLVSGMTVIGSLTIGLLSILFFVNIPTALLAFVVAGAFFGFLPHNMHPAKIFSWRGRKPACGVPLGGSLHHERCKVCNGAVSLGHSHP